MKKKWEQETEEDFDDFFLEDLDEIESEEEPEGSGSEETESEYEADDFDDVVFLDLNEEDEEQEPEKKRGKVSLHFVFLGVFVLIILFVVIRLAVWNVGIKDDTDVSISNPEYDIESMDYILPLNPQYLAGREDDGITTVVCLGNAPFADDRNGENNLTKLMERELGENARVYNCSVADSYMTAMLSTYSDEHAYDAFSFYWLTTAFAVDNWPVVDSALAALPEVPADLQESMELLRSIDFDTVDVIVIMYDANDYLGGRKTINSDNPTDIQYFTGALTAGIQLIQQIYPYIRIMVMSPTYAYALDENGEYQSSDLTDYGMGSLATYAILESNVCYENSVSYIDNLYSDMNANNASDYLTDYIHLNEKGRRFLARRFVECLNMYQGVAAENAG